MSLYYVLIFSKLVTHYHFIILVIHTHLFLSLTDTVLGEMLHDFKIISQYQEYKGQKFRFIQIIT